MRPCWTTLMRIEHAHQAQWILSHIFHDCSQARDRNGPCLIAWSECDCSPIVPDYGKAQQAGRMSACGQLVCAARDWSCEICSSPTYTHSSLEEMRAQNAQLGP